MNLKMELTKPLNYNLFFLIDQDILSFNDLPTMAIIHCGFVPHQNKSINQRLISEWNIPADDSTTKS